MSAPALASNCVELKLTPRRRAASDWLTSPSGLRRLSLCVVALGVVWRVVRYGLQFPLWGDEAFICLSLLDRDFLDLTGPLECGQVAPLLFLWGELAAFRLFGSSEYALRLIPLLAGLGALPLFWRLAWRTLPPMAAAFAVSILSVSYWPVVMSGTVKSYSLDLFMALTLLIAAIEWLDRPHWGWLLFLAGVCPLALFSSFTAVFVAGAVSLALLPRVWREADWVSRSLFALYNALMVASFLGHYLLVSVNQLRGGDGQVDVLLRDYWVNGFPPGNPWDFVIWFVLVHTGRLFAFPVGAADGGSVVSALLAFVGLIALLRAGTSRARLVLFLTPFALNFVAAVLHKYPYGGCCRLSQQLAPAICMAIGMGLASLIDRFAFGERARQRAVAGVFLLLTAVMIGGLARDFYRPYKSLENLALREAMQNVFAQIGPDERVVVLNRADEVDPMSVWWLARFGNGRVEWDPQWQRVASGDTPVWTIQFETIASRRPLSSPGAEPDFRELGQFGIMRFEVRLWTHHNGTWTQNRYVGQAFQPD